MSQRLGDLDRKDVASAKAAEWASKTHRFREGREGACDPELRAHYAQASLVDGARIATTTDGIGTKVEVAERTRVYDTIAFDLVAMVTDDLAAAGATSLVLTNVLDVDRIDPEVVDALMRGLYAACERARIAVSGGEIAELGGRVCGYGDGMHFNWCATAIGHYPPGRPPLTGAALHPGAAIVALASPGFRSNGFSLLRRILEGAHGPSWHEVDALGTTWGARALEPSVIYAPLVSDLLDAGVPLLGAAHVTGGGIPNKLGRILRRTTYGARLDDLFDPPESAVLAQRLGTASDAEVYRAWNMGQGFLLVCEGSAVPEVLAAARAHGHEAKVAGHVDDTRTIRVRSRGIERAELTFPLETTT